MIDKSLKQHYDVPETKKIKGQLHKLAYITAKEANLLQKSGGQKVMTPEGIPAYPPQDDQYNTVVRRVPQEMHHKEIIIPLFIHQLQNQIDKIVLDNKQQ